MVQQVMVYICKESKSGPACAKVVSRMGNNSLGGVKNYYKFMKTIKNSQSHYMNIKSLGVLSSRHHQEVQAFS